MKAMKKHGRVVYYIGGVLTGMMIYKIYAVAILHNMAKEMREKYSRY